MDSWYGFAETWTGIHLKYPDYSFFVSIKITTVSIICWTTCLVWIVLILNWAGGNNLYQFTIRIYIIPLSGALCSFEHLIYTPASPEKCWNTRPAPVLMIPAFWRVCGNMLQSWSEEWHNSISPAQHHSFHFHQSRIMIIFIRDTGGVRIMISNVGGKVSFSTSIKSMLMLTKCCSICHGLPSQSLMSQH